MYPNSFYHSMSDVLMKLNFQVNRNPIADEMKRMRQQIEYLQAELVSARGGATSDDVQVNILNKLRLSKKNSNKNYIHRTSIFRVSERGFHGSNKRMKTSAGNYMIVATGLKMIHVNLKYKYVTESVGMT